MNDSQQCPDTTRLQSLLDGTLPEDAQVAMAAHLESCAECRRQLERLAGGSMALPQDAKPAERRSPALEEAMLKLKSELSEATQTVSETQPGPLSFSFLKPSDNPRHLGRLGSYEILELIGRGGMGIVFKGRDRKLERLVAVKVLSPELASSATARRRFLREAQAAAAVTHEHVVTIHAVDEADGTPFLVMEYIVGVSLEDRIQRSGHLRVEEILRIGMQAASGLAAAHAQGLVHRDIKPSNILLENGVERVKITDFGLARVIHEAQSTQSNVVAGTPQYMSPEQARGEPVDHRSDLFSLGCVLYAMCAGRSPFRAETPTGAIHRVCEDTPRPIREINPDIPDWLVAVIDRLLEKKAEDRFQSATEVAEVLGQYLAHVQQPSRVHSVRDWPPPNSRRPHTIRPLHHPTRASVRRVFASAMLLVLAGALAVWGLWPRPPYSGAVRWRKREGGNDHWYLAVVDQTGVTWDEADRRAREMGGHLVSIGSQKENALVLRLINDARFWREGRVGPWIGAFQLEGAREPDRGWRWVTGEPFLYSDWEPGQPDDSTSVVVRQSHIRYRTLGTSWLGAKWGNASLSVDGFIVEFDDDPPSQQPASDPYGVIFMQQSPPGSSVALVVHREGGKAFHARRELNMSHTLFVAPGRYEWESLTFSEEGVLRQTKKGEVTIRAAQRVVFSAEGPSDKRPETSSSGTMTGAALRVWHGSLARRRKTVDLLTDVCRRAS